MPMTRTKFLQQTACILCRLWKAMSLPRPPNTAAIFHLALQLVQQVLARMLLLFRRTILTSAFVLVSSTQLQR
jgi:hypothetical protein